MSGDVRKRGFVVALVVVVAGLGLVGLGLWSLVRALDTGGLAVRFESSSSGDAKPPAPAGRLRSLLGRLPDLAPADLVSPVGVPVGHPHRDTKMSGRVFDVDSGDGVDGAVVELRPVYGTPALFDAESDGALRYQTDGAGQFALLGVPPGVFELVVQRAGFTTVRTSFKKLSTVEDDAGMEIGLTRAAVVEGVVREATGRPVADAEIYATQPGHPRSLESISTKSGADGTFFLEPIPMRPQQIVAVHPALGIAAVVIAPVPDEANEVEIVFRSVGTIRGRVMGPEGPIEGALVRQRLQWIDGGAVGARAEALPRGVSTDGTGNFTLGAAGDSGVVLSVSASGFVSRDEIIESVPRDGIATAEILLTPALSFGGVVLAAGSPVPRARVSILADGDLRAGHLTVLSAETDSRGRFEIGGVPAEGPYRVHVEHHAHAATDTNLDVVHDHHVFELAPQSVVRGLVRDRLTNAPIQEYAYEVAGPLRRRARAGSVSGAIEVDQLVAGEYAIEVFAEGYAPEGVAGIRLERGETREGVIFLLSPNGGAAGMIRGIEGTGELVVAAWREGGELAAEARVGSDSRFTLAGLPAGEYVLTLSGIDAGSRITGRVEHVAVHPGKVATGIEITAETLEALPGEPPLEAPRAEFPWH